MPKKNVAYPLPRVVYKQSRVYTILHIGRKYAHAIRFGKGAEVEAVKVPLVALKNSTFRANSAYLLSGDDLLDTWTRYAVRNGVASKVPLDLISKSRYHRATWTDLEIK